MSRTLALNKLVRDKLVDEMQALGQQVDFRILNDDEYLRAFKEVTNG